MLNNNYGQRFGQTKDELTDLLQMNVGVNYPQRLFSMVQPFMGKKVLEVLVSVSNVTNVIISEVEQLLAVEPNAACQKDFQIKLYNKIVPLISFIEDKAGCPMGLSLISVSRKEK